MEEHFHLPYRKWHTLKCSVFLSEVEDLHPDTCTQAWLSEIFNWTTDTRFKLQIVDVWQWWWWCDVVLLKNCGLAFSALLFSLAWHDIHCNLERKNFENHIIASYWGRAEGIAEKKGQEYEKSVIVCWFLKEMGLPPGWGNHEARSRRRQYSKEAEENLEWIERENTICQ